MRLGFGKGFGKVKHQANGRSDFFWFVDVGCLFVCLSIHQNDQKVKQTILVKSELAKEQELSTGVLGDSFPQSPRTLVASATNAATPLHPISVSSRHFPCPEPDKPQAPPPI